MTQLSFGRDNQGFNAYAPQQSDTLYSATLAAGVSASITTPSKYSRYIAAFSFQPGVSVWISVNGTAAVPVGGTFAVNVSELNPGSRLVNAGDVIDFISANLTADVGVAFYGVL